MKDTKPYASEHANNKPQANNTDKSGGQTQSEEITSLKNKEVQEKTTQPEADPIVQAEAKIAELESKAAEYLEQLMRSQAELQNVKKRSEREIAQIRNYANKHFAVELLAIKDSLEMGLQSDIKADAKKLHEGLELTLKLLQQTFEKFGIKEINPEGEVFNPELHQAMMTQEDTTKPPNTVLKVLQKGYMMNDQLLRAAMVCVSSAPEASPTSETISQEEATPTKQNNEKAENKSQTAKDTKSEAS